MSNTITNTTLLLSPRKAIIYITLASDGSEETGTIIYDSSAIATTAGDSDPLDCSIQSIYASVSAAAPVVSGGGARVKLLWDATTDVLALDIPAGTNPVDKSFESIGCLPNTGGSGKTGDILLTTTGLESGDAITLVLVIIRN